MNAPAGRTGSERRGFTLVEMSASMIILAVILLACGSIVGLSTRAPTDAAARNSAPLQSADAAAQVADDLNVALNFTQRTSTAVTFTVPDRLNLGAPQQVSYSWAGTTTSPLLRQFNGGSAVAVLSNVQNFQLAYLTRLMGPVVATQQTVVSHTTSTTLKDAPLDLNTFAAEYFTPSLPSGTTSYSLTRLRIMMKGGGQDGIITLRVTAPTLLTNPTANVLATTAIYGAGFSNAYEYIDVPLTGLSGLRPSQTLCFVFSYSSGNGQVGVIETDNALTSILTGASWSTSTNAGNTWSIASSLTAPMFYALGTVP